jgi:4-amino-4-deoxy-L-arabinose transferase-like glycosyltransferase
MAQEIKKITNKQILIALALIFVLALFFRFYKLTELPPGLNSDEATNGIKAQRALQTGNFKFFYSRTPIVMDKRFQDDVPPEERGDRDLFEGYYQNYSREHAPHEGLYVNLVAVSLSIFGNSPWAIRVVSALMGSITVLGLFLLTREFLRWGFNSSDDESRAVKVALLSSFLLAISFWHLIVSRIGFMHILTPTATVFAFFFLFKGLSRSGKLSHFIIGGFTLGIVFHTFLSNRVLPFVAVAAMILAFIMKKRDDSVNSIDIKKVLAYWIMWFVAASPILYHFYNNPGDFTHRASQISTISATGFGSVALLLKNLFITLGQFNFSGDIYSVQNLPYSPALNLFVGIFFLIGVTISFYHLYKFISQIISRERPGRSESLSLLLLFWILATLAPAFLSSGPHPHSFRSFNAVVPVTLLSAIGGVTLYNFIKERFSSTLGAKGTSALAAIILLVAAASEYKEYFIDWAAIDTLESAHHKELVNIGHFINEAPKGYKKFIITNHSPAPVQFITDTYVEDNRAEKNIVYLLPNKKTHINYYNERPYLVIALQYEEELFKQLIKNVPGKYTYEEDFGYFIMD